MTSDEEVAHAVVDMSFDGPGRSVGLQSSSSPWAMLGHGGQRRAAEVLGI